MRLERSDRSDRAALMRGPHLPRRAAASPHLRYAGRGSAPDEHALFSLLATAISNNKKVVFDFAVADEAHGF